MKLWFLTLNFMSIRIYRFKGGSGGNSRVFETGRPTPNPGVFPPQIFLMTLWKQTKQLSCGFTWTPQFLGETLHVTGLFWKVYIFEFLLNFIQLNLHTHYNWN